MVFSTGNLSEKIAANFSTSLKFFSYQSGARATKKDVDGYALKLSDWFQKFSEKKSIRFNVKAEFSRNVANFEAGDHQFNLDDINWLQREIFFAAEHHCKNRKLFWQVAAEIWIYSGNSDTRWEEAFNRYDRCELVLHKRVGYFGSRLDDDKGKFVSAFLSSTSTNAEISVYRGGHARSGKSIRQGETKIDEDWFVQEEGASYSYTLSKSIAAQWGGAQYNNEILRRHTQLSESEIYDFHNANLAEGLRSINKGEDVFFIGEYKINKKDIIGMFYSRRQEQEIVSVKSTFVRYEIISVRKALIAYFIRVFRESAEQNSGNKILKLFGQDEIRLWNTIDVGVTEAIKTCDYDYLINKNNKSEMFNMIVELSGITSIGSKEEKHYFRLLVS
jgi:hypothetical protein